MEGKLSAANLEKLLRINRSQLVGYFIVSLYTLSILRIKLFCLHLDLESP